MAQKQPKIESGGQRETRELPAVRETSGKAARSMYERETYTDDHTGGSRNSAASDQWFEQYNLAPATIRARANSSRQKR